MGTKEDPSDTLRTAEEAKRRMWEGVKPSWSFTPLITRTQLWVMFCLLLLLDACEAIKLIYRGWNDNEIFSLFPLMLLSFSWLTL